MRLGLRFTLECLLLAAGVLFRTCSSVGLQLDVGAGLCVGLRLVGLRLSLFELSLLELDLRSLYVSLSAGDVGLGGERDVGS